MIVREAAEFCRQLETGNLEADAPALPRAVLMVAPKQFRVSAETAADNRYMDPERATDAERAERQFAGVVSLLESHGITVVSFPGKADCPDGVFPNNVFGTAPGRFVIGRMRYPGRQREARRADIAAYFARAAYRRHDLSEKACIAELTGPLVIDRARRIGFCGMTGRVDQAGCDAMHAAFDLRLTYSFDLAPGEYHTNVVMAVLAGRACVLHAPSFRDPRVPQSIAAAFDGRVLWLDDEEKNAFAGNCIALTDEQVFMSAGAEQALRPVSRKTLGDWGFEVCSTPLDEIEKAGGSLRCMVAEIF